MMSIRHALVALAALSSVSVASQTPVPPAASARQAAVETFGFPSGATGNDACRPAPSGEVRRIDTAQLREPQRGQLYIPPALP